MRGGSAARARGSGGELFNATLQSSNLVLERGPTKAHTARTTGRARGRRSAAAASGSDKILKGRQGTLLTAAASGRATTEVGLTWARRGEQLLAHAMHALGRGHECAVQKGVGGGVNRHGGFVARTELRTRTGKGVAR